MHEPRRALVTGLSGQDGSYLAELLLGKGYEVHGLVRCGLGSAAHLEGRVTTHRGDLRDAASLAAALEGSAPAEVYHLGGLSHAGGSWAHPEEMMDVVAGGTARLLDAVAARAPEARVFCASSAEVFGAPDRAPQDEQTPLRPRNPYGAAKVGALAAARAWRAAGRAWVATGILFNHESPRRPTSFVTRKITAGAAAIAAGRETELRLGALDATRDWGYAPDYVAGAWAALQAATPDEYVFATGASRSVRDLLEVAFARAGVDPEGHVVVDPAFVRPEGDIPSVGDASKARDVLGWLPSTPFEAMITEMVDHDMQALRA